MWPIALIRPNVFEPPCRGFCGSETCRPSDRWRYKSTCRRPSAHPKKSLDCSPKIPQDCKFKDDLEFRREVAVRVGLGFELPSGKTVVGPNGPKIETEAFQEIAASV
jgi:hypothetical protein